MVILVIFAYQLSRLIKTVNTLERNSEGLSAFISEKRIIIGQFITFVFAFTIKIGLNLQLIFSE